MKGNKFKLKNLSQSETNNLFPDDIILAGYRGSISHGTYRPQQGSDDRDILGVFIGPREHYVGLGRKNCTTYEKFEGCFDIVCYEVRKYFNLLLSSNPNVLSLIGIPDNLILYQNEWGEEIRENAGLFLSKQAKKSFCGYAYSQLLKAEKDEENLEELKELADLDEKFPDRSRISQPYSDEERKYIDLADKYYSGYMGKKRKQKVLEYGYDPKHCEHLIRLLRTGLELLVEGELNIYRPDNKELLEIKKGKWEFLEIKKEANRLFDLVDEAYIHSDLPDKPDEEEAEDLLMKIIIDSLEEE